MCLKFYNLKTSIFFHSDLVISLIILFLGACLILCQNYEFKTVGGVIIGVGLSALPKAVSRLVKPKIYIDVPKEIERFKPRLKIVK